MTLDATAMQLVARWVTHWAHRDEFRRSFFYYGLAQIAAKPPMMIRAQDSAWMTPQSVLDAFASGDMDLMTPTLRMLKNLSQHESSLMFFPISKHTNL